MSTVDGTYATHTAYSDFYRNSGTNSVNVNAANTAYTNKAAKDANAPVHAAFNDTNATVNTTVNTALATAENAAAYSAANTIANIAEPAAAIPIVPQQRPPWNVDPGQVQNVTWTSNVQPFAMRNNTRFRWI